MRGLPTHGNAICFQSRELQLRTRFNQGGIELVQCEALTLDK